MTSASLFACVLAACAADPADVTSEDGGLDANAAADGGVLRPSDGGRPRTDAATPPVVVHQPSYQDVFDQGITRYVGTPMVEETEVTTSGFGSSAIDVHHFSTEDRGPACMRGSEFFVETREGASDTLMIFLQGGGVCLTEICAATPDPILTLRLFRVAGLLGIGGLLDPRSDDNPTKDFDVVNAPYCDGSLFAGDVDRILSDGNPDNGTDDLAFQRGLQNLTATLETAHRYFPNPPRVVLVGSSGGAYGVIAGTVMTRYFYPDVPLLVISDSGAPVVNGVDTGFITRALTEFGALDMIPSSCPDCLANGHATGIIAWAMGFDTELSFAYMTHARDHVIGEFFMGTTADEFQAAVVQESGRLMQAFPGRAYRFIVPSSRHTLAMGIDSLSDDLQGTFLGLAGGLGFGFVGDDVTSEELSTWSLGGMKETGIDASGSTWIAYDWVRTLLEHPASTPDVLQL